MNFGSGRHCSIMRSIGVPLGLWPYGCTSLGKVNGAIALTIIVLYILAQLAVFITHEVNVDLVFKCLTGMVPPMMYVVKYLFFMWKMDQVKYIFEWIQYDYDSLTNERELRLTDKYADRGRIISNVWLYFLLLVLIPIGLPYLTVLFNIEIPNNQTRTVLLPIKVEYFVDQDRYFYWIALHFDTTTLLGISILFVTESASIHFIIHACGLLEITGDRVERLLESSIPTALCDKTYLSMNGQLVSTIKLHQRALNFIEYLNTSFLPHYCTLLVIGVISLSMNLYILAREMMLMNVTSEMLIALVLAIHHFVYMACGNYIGQIMLDNGDELFSKSYNARWHEAPLPVQKMLVYIRQRSILPTALVFGGLYTVSFEFFSKLVNASMSYLTVLYSTA